MERPGCGRGGRKGWFSSGRWKGPAPCGRTAFGTSIFEMSPPLGHEGGRNCTMAT